MLLCVVIPPPCLQEAPGGLAHVLPGMQRWQNLPIGVSSCNQYTIQQGAANILNKGTMRVLAARL